MVTEFAVMIPTTQGREAVLVWSLRHLVKHVPVPFTVYIYNDQAGPLAPTLIPIVTSSGRTNVNLQVLNEYGELSRQRTGCCGARHFLFEKAKKAGHTMVASLDDDIQVTAEWFPAITKAMIDFPDHSVFSTPIWSGRENGPIHSVGAEMLIKDGWLHRIHIKTFHDSEYRLTAWTSTGAMVLCRKALCADISIPKEQMVCEDEALFLQLFRIGANETVICNRAGVIHRPLQTLDLRKRRSYEAIQGVARFMWHTYGVNITRVLTSLRRRSLPADEAELRTWVD